MSAEGDIPGKKMTARQECIGDGPCGNRRPICLQLRKNVNAIRGPVSEIGTAGLGMPINLGWVKLFWMYEDSIHGYVYMMLMMLFTDGPQDV